ncbi:hypothetical protein [Pseudoclavibacter helvolus]|nr:hypothetical protein [Pseudoclavibacter helvolus]
MFKTEAAKTSSSNWNLQATCSKGHTVFKNQFKSGDQYRCPYCGNDVH